LLFLSHVDFRSMPVDVEVSTPGGHLQSIRAENAWLVRDVKKALADRTGLAVHAQLLRVGNRRLGDVEKLSSLSSCFDGVLRIACARHTVDHMCWITIVESPDAYLKLAEAFVSVRADYEIMLAAGRRDPRCLKHAAVDLLANAEFVLEAAACNSDALQWASKELWADSNFVLKALDLSWHALSNAAPELRADPDFVTLVAMKNKWAVHDAADELRTDVSFLQKLSSTSRRNYVMDSVKRDGRSLRRAQDLKGDVDVVMAALGSTASALQFAAPELRADSAIVRFAIDKSPTASALQFAAPELRADPKLVRIAINKCPLALQWAAPALRADRSIVTAAVSKDGTALKWVAPELRKDSSITSLCSDGFVAAKRADKVRRGLPVRRPVSRGSSRGSTPCLVQRVASDRAPTLLTKPIRRAASAANLWMVN